MTASKIIKGKMFWGQDVLKIFRKQIAHEKLNIEWILKILFWNHFSPSVFIRILYDRTSILQGFYMIEQVFCKDFMTALQESCRNCDHHVWSMCTCPHAHVCRNGSVANFFITLKFNLIYYLCGESKVPFITFWIFSLLS